MEIDWPAPGISAYVHAHPGQWVSFGVACAGVIFRNRPFTLGGPR
jgi:hypothetical protein